MAGPKDIANIWKNVREVDLRPIRESALQPVKIALVGAPGSGRRTLANQMRLDPSRPDIQALTPVKILDIESAPPAPDADLIILMLDATRNEFRREEALARRWGEIGRNILIFVNKLDALSEGQIINDWIDWPAGRLVYGSARDPASLQQQFIPIVMELLPDLHLALGRNFPLFRVTICRHLINDTSFSNAAYALTTGIGEIFPALGVPLNIADIVVLTKAQAFLVYRLGLTIGFSTEWRDYVAEFSSVIGGGFMWRQLARQLVGLVPVWGIIPKVGVAYAGTYVVGNAVFKWYLTGKHLTRAQMRELYVHAFQRGKKFARQLASRAPRPRLPGRRKQARLPAPTESKECPNCGKPNAAGASYCQYCGSQLSERV